MNAFDKLVRHFERFPGIGGRQAKRLAFHILKMPSEETEDLSRLIREIHTSVITCTHCFRFFPRAHSGSLCSLCSNPNRDQSKLMIVERDSDIDAVERSGVYDGLYFVFGGTVPLLGSQDINHVRGGALKRRIQDASEHQISEIILGFSVNPDGENTGRYIEMLLRDEKERFGITLSHLGRGLSTGSELEYADPETVKSALKNRSV